MKRDIALFTRSCHLCQQNKPKQKTIEKLRLTATPQHTFDKIVIDTVGPLPKSFNDNIYILTLMCDLSKFIICVPIPNKTAITVAKAIVEHLILTFGHVKQILSDCGTKFLNQVLSETLKLLKIEQIHSTPYRHQTVGTIERNHRVLNEYLRSYLINIDHWEEYKYVAFCYNSMPHISFNEQFTPFELIFGKKFNILNIFSNNVIEPIYNIENYASELKYKLQKNKYCRL